MNGHLSSQQQAMDIRTLMEESVEVLRTYRHDLMNQVQLIQAYSQMKKFDRLQEPVQFLVAEAQRHTEWSSFPSSMLSYVVLSRDITYPMLNLHVSYEQTEVPPDGADAWAAQVLAGMLDTLGKASKTVLEPLAVDVWIVPFSQGYEIGWFISEQDEPGFAAIDWEAWARTWQHQGALFSQERVEDGMEYAVRMKIAHQGEA